MITIQKEICKPIPQDAVFIQGKVKINADYFIKKIDEGVLAKDNINYRTNVIGQMTSWKYFFEDVEFLKFFSLIRNYVGDHFSEKRYVLSEVWGNKLVHFDRTRDHDHTPNLFSGSLYLNSHPQKLYFPQIKQEVTPEEGTFVIFSSFLRHHTETVYTDVPKYGLAFNVRYD